MSIIVSSVFRYRSRAAFHYMRESNRNRKPLSVKRRFAQLLCVWRAGGWRVVSLLSGSLAAAVDSARRGLILW